MGESGWYSVACCWCVFRAVVGNICHFQEETIWNWTQKMSLLFKSWNIQSFPVTFPYLVISCYLVRLVNKHTERVCVCCVCVCRCGCVSIDGRVCDWLQWLMSLCEPPLPPYIWQTGLAQSLLLMVHHHKPVLVKILACCGQGHTQQSFRILFNVCPGNILWTGWIFCNKTWYGDASSWAGVSCKKIALLSSKSKIALLSSG